MAAYSHQKKAHKRYRRLLPALLMGAVLGAAFAFLYGNGILARPVTEMPVPPVTAAPITPAPAPEVPPTVLLADKVGEKDSVPKNYAPLPRWDGRRVEAREDVKTWGVDILIPATTETRCRFINGCGALMPDYQWGMPVPESEPVEDAFFADAVFIGNSLEQGFMIYSGLTVADMFATQSITVDNIYYEEAVNVGNGEYITILDAVARGSYRKIYVMLGLNEISLNTETFSRLYGRLIDELRRLQPDADVYLQSMTPVSARQSGSGSVFNNKRIREYNEVIRLLAEEKQAHYVYVYESLADEEGNLPSGWSHDGIHPYSQHYSLWLDYLKTHTVLEVRR